MTRDMKDSGIEWAKTIPNNWKVKRIKYLMKELKNKTSNGCEERALSVTQDKGIIPSIEANIANPSSSYENYMEVKKGDLIFNKYKAHSGVFFVTQYDGIVTFNYSIYRCFKGVNSKYCEYLFKTSGCISEFKQRLHGVGESISPLYTKDLFDIAVIMPPFEEQNRIVNFLDVKCGEIDALSEDIQSEIDTLEAYKRSVITEAVTKGLEKGVFVKESGIPWIGMIPEHWKASKIKYEIFPVEKRTTERDGIITCFRDGEVTLRSKRREEGFTVSLTEHGYHGVDIGDLVIHGMDAFAGAIGCSDSRGKTTPVVHVCKTTGNNRFFMYCLRSMAYGNILMDLSDGIRVRSSDFRNFSKLGVFGIAVAPVQEQNEIVAYLDKICSEIESIIAQKREQLTVLADYKKSVIYEYVTGKKEVPVI